MKSQYILAIIAISPQIITTIISLIINHKVKKQGEIQQEIDVKFNLLDKKIDENRKKELRNVLVNDYTDLIKGKKKSKEQLQNISDMFDEYKSLKGDSYVDDLHDIWKEKESKWVTGLMIWLKTRL